MADREPGPPPPANVDIATIEEEAHESRFWRIFRWCATLTLTAVLVSLSIRGLQARVHTLQHGDFDAGLWVYFAPFLPFIILLPLALWGFYDRQRTIQETRQLFPTLTTSPKALRRRRIRSASTFAVLSLLVFYTVIGADVDTCSLLTMLVILTARSLSRLRLNRTPEEVDAWLAHWSSSWLLEHERAAHFCDIGDHERARARFLDELSIPQGRRVTAEVLTNFSTIEPPDRARQLLHMARRLNGNYVLAWVRLVHVEMNSGERPPWLLPLARLAHKWRPNLLNTATLAWVLATTDTTEASERVKEAEALSVGRAPQNDAEAMRVLELAQVVVREANITHES